MLQKVLDRKNLEAYRVRDLRLPSNSFIICSKAMREILLKPWLTGARLNAYAKECSKIFLRCAAELTPLRSAPVSDICEVVALAGGLAYQIDDAFTEVFGATLQRCFVGMRRKKLDGGWQVEVSYLNFEALPKKAYLIIGDTVATGVTACELLSLAVQKARERNCLLEGIIFFSIACSRKGAEKLAEFEKAHKIPIYLFAGLEYLGLAENGTDLPFLHPDAILPASTERALVFHYGAQLSRLMPCAIFDWGDRTKNPLKHLHEFAEICQELLKSATDQKAKRILKDMMQKSREEADRMGCALGGLPLGDN